MVLRSVETVSFEHPAVQMTPYTGNSLPNIPEWSGLGQEIGQLLAGYISGSQSTQSVLASAQQDTIQAFKDSGRSK
jgi:sorbitol/mannitol transport system substrate-binding protein